MPVARSYFAPGRGHAWTPPQAPGGGGEDDAPTTSQKYVRAGASGSASGDDWTNAYTSLPVTLVRDTTYWVADGSYSDKLFDDATSGTQVIRIKKATVALHGTDTGWSDAYGDGQAIFTGKLKFRKGYYTFDGSVRNESNWFTKSAYGFVIEQNADAQQIKIGGLTSGGGDDYSGEPGANNVTIKYTYIQAGTLPSGGVRMYAIDTESSTSATGILISRCCVNNGNNHYFIRNTNGAIIEYCGSEDALNNSNNHGEIVNCYYNTPNAVIRFNHFRNNYQPGGYSGTYYAGTAMVAIVTSANVLIYGNIFERNCNTDGSVGWYGTNGSYSVTGLRFHHNTIVDGGFGPQGVRLETGSSDCFAYNNLWINASALNESCTHDYNGYSDSDDDGEANGQINIPTSIFVNYAGDNFRLASSTNAGTNLGSPYDTDMDGVTRSTWDRGAFEST